MKSAKWGSKQTEWTLATWLQVVVEDDDPALVTEYEYGYDPDENSAYTLVTDPMDKTLHTYVDLRGRTVKTVADHGGIAQTAIYTYEQPLTDGYSDTVVAKNEPEADQVTEYKHRDPVDAGLVTETVYPDGGVVASEYYADGTPKQKTDQRGWTTSFTRDDLGRVIGETVDADNGSAIEGTVRAAYVYDALGRTVGEFNLDKRGMYALVRRSYTWGLASSATKMTTAEMHLPGARTVKTVNDQRTGVRESLEYPSGWQVAYDHDDLHRVTGIIDDTAQGDPDISTYTYLGDYVGQRTLGDSGLITWGLADGLSHYDDFGRPILYNYKHDTADLVKLNYAYDDVSNLTWRHDEKMQGSHSVYWTQKYAYDTLHRLARADQGQVTGDWPDVTMETPALTWVWSGDHQSQTYSMDKLGNWQKSYNGDANDERDHNEVNEITSREVASNGRDVEYDAAGNVIKYEHETSSGTEVLQFAYDYRNRLISVTRDCEEVAAYFYDTQNRRTRKHLTGGAETVYLYDGWQCIEERDGTTGEVLRQYVYGSHYLDELVAKRDPSDGSLTFYLQDSNYNVVAIVDDEGGVVERYCYEPYGKVTITAPDGGTQQTILNDTLLFQGQRRDPETGLYYYRNRYYSSELGRFIQRDPSEYQDGMNLYLFCRGIPVAVFDPMGLGFWDRVRNAALRGVGGALGGAATGGLVGAIIAGTGGTVIAPGPGTLA